MSSEKPDYSFYNELLTSVMNLIMTYLHGLGIRAVKRIACCC